MTSTEERVRDVLRAYRADVTPPDVSVIHARAHQQKAGRPEPPRHRLAGRGALFTLLALGVGVPATAAGAVVAIHHFVDDPADPLKGANPDSKDPNASPSDLPARVTGNTEQVTGGYVTLTVQPGTVDDRSCFALVHKNDAGEVIESEDACGGGSGVTTVDSFGGVSVVYSDDPGATRVIVQNAGARYDRRLHACYALTPMLTAGPVTTTTYRANGSVIAVHHGEAMNENGTINYENSDPSAS